jgi:hypothetical protein
MGLVLMPRATFESPLRESKLLPMYSLQRYLSSYLIHRADTTASLSSADSSSADSSYVGEGQQMVLKKSL